MQLPVSLKRCDFWTTIISAPTPGMHQQHKMKRLPDASLTVSKAKAAAPVDTGAAEKACSRHRETCHETATPSGIWADGWDLDADTTILVFYDAENDDKVERAALGQKGE